LFSQHKPDFARLFDHFYQKFALRLIDMPVVYHEEISPYFCLESLIKLYKANIISDEIFCKICVKKMSKFICNENEFLKKLSSFEFGEKLFFSAMIVIDNLISNLRDTENQVKLAKTPHELIKIKESIKIFESI
jgi:hypothetical protein